MPTEMTILAYTYAELSDKAKEKARQKYGELDHRWWDDIHVMYKDVGWRLGFCIDTIFFSGFSSQGDGASWAGSVDAKVYLERRLEEAKGAEVTRLTALVSLATQKCLTPYPKITQSGRYSHEQTMHIDTGSCQWNDEERIMEGSLQGADIATLAGMYCTEEMQEALDAEMLEAARDYAREIYGALEKEYDRLTSEECFAELCEANDYKFNEDGSMV